MSEIWSFINIWWQIWGKKGGLGLL
jgi:hypothetical protein